MSPTSVVWQIPRVTFIDSELRSYGGIQSIWAHYSLTEEVIILFVRSSYIFLVNPEQIFFKIQIMHQQI